jgi:hypothetical protein
MRNLLYRYNIHTYKCVYMYMQVAHQEGGRRVLLISSTRICIDVCMYLSYICTCVCIFLSVCIDVCMYHTYVCTHTHTQTHTQHVYCRFCIRKEGDTGYEYLVFHAYMCVCNVCVCAYIAGYASERKAMRGRKVASLGTCMCS